MLEISLFKQLLDSGPALARQFLAERQRKSMREGINS